MAEIPPARYDRHPEIWPDTSRVPDPCSKTIPSRLATRTRGHTAMAITSVEPMLT